MTGKHLNYEQFTALETLLKAYIAQRDCHYESLTLANGEYPDEGTEYIIKEMDGIISRAHAALRM